MKITYITAQTAISNKLSLIC